MSVMSEVLIKIGVDTSDIEPGLSKAEGAINGFSNAIVGGLKVGIAAIGAATTAVGFLVKKSVESYAEYEQLQGGVQKLYGNMGMSLEDYANSVGKSMDEVRGEWQSLETAQNLVLQNAENAYKTSGMSMNQYMETATSFSAALINSLGGDTVEAAKQTDVAMRAISDNFNTFGGDIGSITYAFQGFAKQNYTMLDNLKLGYGGTKQEMERLIADANEYAESIGKAGDLSIDSFSDIVTAIDLVQQKQNIAGTTAREASTTIAGSLGSLKAAWENLLTGMSNSDADVGKLIDNVVSSATTALGNLFPVVEQALNGVVTLIQNIAPLISQQLPSLIGQILPKLISAGVSLISGVVSALPEIVKALVDALPQVLSDIVNSLRSSAPSIIGSLKSIGSDLINGLIDGLRNGIPNLMPYVTEIIPSFIDWLMDGFDDITDIGIDIINALADGISKVLPDLIPVAMEAIMTFSGHLRENVGDIVDAGINLIMTLASALIDALPVFIETVPTIISNIAGIINDNAPKLVMAGFQLIVELAQGIIDSVPTLIEEFPKIIQAIFDLWMAINWLQLGSQVIKFITNGIKSLAKNIPDLLKSIGREALNGFKNINWTQLGYQVIQFVLSGIRSIMTQIPSLLRVIGGSAISAFRGVNWASVGSAAISFILNGIRALMSNIPSTLRSIGHNAMSAFRSINWASVGSNIISGIVSGIWGAAGNLFSSLRSLASDALASAKSLLKIGSPSKVFRDEVGRWIPEGMAIGITANADAVEDALEGLADTANLGLDDYDYEIITEDDKTARKGSRRDERQVVETPDLLNRVNYLIGVLEYYLPKNGMNDREINRVLGAMM